MLENLKKSKKGILKLRHRVTTESSSRTEGTKGRRGGYILEEEARKLELRPLGMGPGQPSLVSLRQRNKADVDHTGRNRKLAAAPAKIQTLWDIADKNSKQEAVSH